MIRAVVDEVVPLDVVPMLSTALVAVDTFPGEWRSQGDGAVIASAVERGYRWLITCDKRMAFQQNLSGRAISVLVLPSPQIFVIERIRDKLLTALCNPIAGHFVVLGIDGMPISEPAPQFVGPARRNR